jgi:hypothetical protein
MRFRQLSLGLGLCATILPIYATAAVTEDNFQLRTTADLVELCSAQPSESLGTAALNFCHGFGVGVFRVLQEQQMAERSRHLFCMPSPQPTRNEALASLLQWTKANPQQLTTPPQDGIVMFLSQQYPCANRK